MRSMPDRTGLRFLACGLVLLLVGCADEVVGPEEQGNTDLILFAASPEGATEGGLEVFVIRPDGSGLKQLTQGAMAFLPTWSPDGEMIAFTSLAEGDHNVFVMNADGSDLRRVTTGTEEKYYATWHPDGDRILYQQDDLYSVPLEGGEPTLVHTCPDNCRHPAWSPDGSRIAFVNWGSGSPRIALLDVASGEVTPLESGGDYEHMPRWSPDGSSLLFLRRGVEGRIGLAVARPDGSLLSTAEPGQLTVSWDPGGFSPDGTRIAVYQSDRSASQAGLRHMAPDGTDVRAIIDFAEVSDVFVAPRWRP